MKTLILMTIVFATVIGLTSTIADRVNNERKKERIDIFAYSFLGGLLGAIVGSLTGFMIGCVIYFVFNFVPYLRHSDELLLYAYLAGLCMFIICWLLGIIVGGFKTIKPLLKLFSDKK